MNVTTKKRGWVEVYPASEGGLFMVHDWSEYYDSGCLVGEFPTRSEALEATRAWAAQYNRKIVSAEVVSLSDFRGEDTL